MTSSHQRRQIKRKRGRGEEIRTTLRRRLAWRDGEREKLQGREWVRKREASL